MKRWIAAVCTLLLLLTLFACGKAQPQAEMDSTTEPPTAGRYSDKDSFSVWIPENWCKMEYRQNGQKLHLFNTSSADKIKDDTDEIVIEMAKEKADSIDDTMTQLLSKVTAKESDKRTIDGYSFRSVIYTHVEGRRYTVLVGLVDGHVTTVTLKGLHLDTDKTAQAVVDSITFK